MGATHFTGPVIVGDPSTTPSQQGEIEVYQDIVITYAQTPASATTNFTLNIPPGSVIMGFEIATFTAWAGPATAVMTIGSDATTNKSIYVGNTDLKAAAPFPAMTQTAANIAAQRGYTAAGVAAPIPGPINIQVVNGAGAPSAGAALVSVHYVQQATP
jgi:hypothetical protein